MGSFAVFVSKKYLWKFYRTFRESQRQTKPISVPVLPEQVLRDVYDNTVGFILGGKEKRKQYEKYHIPFRRGVLLAGSPGCGKTMSCKWVRDLCHRKHIDTEVITLDKYRRRMSEGDVMSIFRSNIDRPKIVFFDDLDVMIRDRKSGNIDIYHFLSGLDGLDTKEGVVNIFTTNQMDDLDEAFVRPGRIDLFVPFSAPSAKLRKSFVEKKFGADIQKQIDIDVLIQKTEGYTFAELEEIRKLLCFDEMAGKPLDLGQSLVVFDRHREQFKNRSTFGFGRMEEDQNDLFGDDFMPMPEEFRG